VFYFIFRDDLRFCAATPLHLRCVSKQVKSCGTGRGFIPQIPKIILISRHRSFSPIFFPLDLYYLPSKRDSSSDNNKIPYNKLNAFLHASLPEAAN
jgi:hypothetical protein